MGYSSGYLARELGMGREGVLPSRPDRSYVLHGNQTRASISAITGKPATQADLDAARAIAGYPENEALDQFTRQTLAEGARYGRQQQGDLNRTRMAGTALAGGGGAAGLIALIDYLQSSKIETSERD